MRDLIKDVTITVIIAFGVVFCNLFLWTSIGQNGFLDSELAKTLFSALIQVNATIIGFAGVIIVYYLKLLQDKRREEVDYHYKLLQNMQQIPNELRDCPDESYKKYKMVELKAIDKESENSERRVLNIDKRVKKTVYFGTITVCCFIASIFFLILFIGRINVAGADTRWFFISIMCLFLGIIYLFQLFLMTSPNVGELETELKKINEQQRK